MLLQPHESLMEYIKFEVADKEHPSHYPTFMPEQEYLGRLIGTCSEWRHLSCAYNFEIDKNRRVPFDFSEEHKRL